VLGAVGGAVYHKVDFASGKTYVFCQSGIKILGWQDSVDGWGGGVVVNTKKKST